MATTMGGVSSAMVGLSISAAGSSEGRLISRKTVDLVSAVYVPVAIIMILYALFTYEWRSRFMHKKQVGAGVRGWCQAMQYVREGGKGVDNTGTAWHGLLAQKGLMHVVSLHV